VEFHKAPPKDDLGLVEFGLLIYILLPNCNSIPLDILPIDHVTIFFGLGVRSFSSEGFPIPTSLAAGRPTKKAKGLAPKHLVLSLW